MSRRKRRERPATAAEQRQVQEFADLAAAALAGPVEQRAAAVRRMTRLADRLRDPDSLAGLTAAELHAALTARARHRGPTPRLPAPPAGEHHPAAHPAPGTTEETPPMPNARQAAWSDLTDAPEVVTAARNKIAQEIDLIEQTERYTPEHKAQLIAEKREALEQLAREQLGRAQAARDTLLTTAQQLDAPAGDTTAQLLAETRQGRAWDRVRGQLDAGRHWATVLDEATAARDSGTVLAMAAELPAWLQSQSREPVDVEQLRQAVDVATFKVLGDDQGRGTAARLRLHASTRFPLAQQVIEQAALGGNLTRAMSISYARSAAEAVEAKLGDPLDTTAA